MNRNGQLGESALFQPFTLRGLTVRNRIVVSPMCQYSSHDGFATDWHLVHLGSRAVGGAGLVFTEAAAVEPRGRISLLDLGLWRDEHVEVLSRITRFIAAQGAAAAVQLAHAGRKGPVGPPWERHGWVEPADGGWVPVAPTAQRDMPHYPLPHALEPDEIAKIVRAFAAAAARGVAAGFGAVEIHAAHGYLLHEFLSPLANAREDAYGGSFERRIRFTLDVTDAVRVAVPETIPLFVRISATDWEDGGWTLDDSVELARRLAARGVDLIDVSSAGIGRSPLELTAQAPGYQVPFAARIRHEACVPTMAVGMILDGAAAEAVLTAGAADLVAVGRRVLGDPYFPHRAARQLGVDLPWPREYRRATLADL